MSKQKRKTLAHPKQARYFWLRFMLLCLLVGLGVLTLKTGQISLNWRDFFNTLIHLNKDQLLYDVFYYIRLPRLLAAILVGAALSLGGLVAQSTLRNDLAEPYLLGISSGAAFGAALAILISFPFIEVFAFIFAFVALFFVLLIGSVAKRDSTLNLILGGVMINAIFTSGVMFLIQVGTHQRSILFWLMGDLSYLPLNTIFIYAIFFILIYFIFQQLAKGLDFFSLQDQEIKTLGFNPIRLRIIFLVLSSLLVAFAVSYVGIIGFVGLVVPHLARMLLGTHHRFLLPLSCLLGATLLLGADILTKISFWQNTIPIGLVTSLLGAPFFLFLLLRQKKNV